ncbi:MAG TPA: PAS domain S-box protein [Bacteroidota bacterium]|mgnify:FL=1|nr:PAS domain S-box protein [Bacteroidota bacterium]
MVNFKRLKKFRLTLGPVEQLQIVISTIVVVSLATIFVVRWTSGQKLEWLLFGSVLTVGIFGFIIVTITLKYGRILEEQKQELMALNSFAQTINRSVDINELLTNALREILRILDVQYGWIYQIENGSLKVVASYQTGSMSLSIFNQTIPQDDPLFHRLKTMYVVKIPEQQNGMNLQQYEHLHWWASIPIHVKNNFAGTIVVASTSQKAFDTKQSELISAFANQLGVALENANLFERLRRSQEQYIDLFENSPDMTHLVNKDGIIVSCNATEAKMLGYSKEELIGFPLTKLYPPAYHAEVKKMLDKIFNEKKELWGIEEKMVTSDGRILDVSVNALLMKDEKGEEPLMRAVARDITEKKKLEANIIHAQRIDSIGNLAGGIAHDFNNILTSILGSTAIMMRRIKRQKENFRFIEIIDSTAKRGASLTRQLLTFARKSAVHVHPILVSDIVRETVTLFERSIDKSIKISMLLPSQTFIIKGDDGQIQQALLNILINARDAMPNGGVITISMSNIKITRNEITSPDQQPGEYVAISITDNGIGMEPEICQRIFEPFFTTKEQGKGTGLGLSVVYGVVNSHNGFVTVHSVPGKGSEFILHFPIYKTTIPEIIPQKSEKLPRGTERILVVDDEDEVLEVVCGMLRELGYIPTAVNSGQKALTLLRKNESFDAVLLDLNMPKMSGQTTCLKIKGMNPSQRVIVATGYSNRIVSDSPLQNKVEAFLQKPFQFEELAKTLRSVLDSPSVTV